LVFDHIDGLWFGEVDDLTSASKGTTAQALMAIRAALKHMLFTTGGKLQASGTIVLGVALSAWLGLALGSVRFDEGRWVLGRVLKLVDAGEGSSELSLEQRVLLGQQRQVLSQHLVFGLKSRELLCRWHAALSSRKFASGTLVSPQVLRCCPGTDLP
jgi:hypothetical protein